VIGALLLRELRLALTGGNAALPLVFFLLVAALFPFAVGPDAPLLARTGGGALWIAALLAALLPIDRLVEPDRAAGVLDQLAVRGVAEESVAAAKLIGHWLSFGPPLMLAALPAAGLMKLPSDVLLRLELGLLAGTPGLAALTLIVAALTAGLRSTGALAGLLMLPLAVPLLIFGAAMVEPSAAPGPVKLLAAVSLLLVAIAPFAAGAAMRAARD
jgi:heme exporter protein B